MRCLVATFSFFDTGKEGGQQSEPERFYHGFVLGLLADQAEQYEIRSNRESGFGRYDVMMIPRDSAEFETVLAFILEFKVRNPGKEASLEETVQTALEQIEKQSSMTRNCLRVELKKSGSGITDLRLMESRY